MVWPMNNLAPGIYDNLDAAQYHADAAVGSSTLKTIAGRTPAHLAAVREPTRAMEFGSAFHIAVLEPEKLESQVVRGPEDRRGNKWTIPKAEAEAAGKILMVSHEYDEVFRMRDAVHADAGVAELLRGKTAMEQSIFWVDPETGIPCRARADCRNYDLNILIDVKTANDASARGFARDLYSLGYHIQDAHYCAGYRHHHVMVDAFLFIAVEKTFPYLSAVYELDRATRAEGWNVRQEAMQTLLRCRQSGVWPGYPSGVQRLRIPAYGFKTLDPNDMMFAEIPAVQV